MHLMASSEDGQVCFGSRWQGKCEEAGREMRGAGEAAAQDLKGRRW